MQPTPKACVLQAPTHIARRILLAPGPLKAIRRTVAARQKALAAAGLPAKPPQLRARIAGIVHPGPGQAALPIVGPLPRAAVPMPRQTAALRPARVPPQLRAAARIRLLAEVTAEARMPAAAEHHAAEAARLTVAVVAVTRTGRNLAVNNKARRPASLRRSGPLLFYSGFNLRNARAKAACFAREVNFPAHLA